MKRYGTVLVFDRGASKKDIRRALNKISNVLEENRCIISCKGGTYKRADYRIEEFDDKLGGPVWYLP